MVIDTTGRASSVADRTQATGTPKIKRHFFPELQGIRAVAILLMVFVHTSFSSGALYYTGHQGDGFLAVLIERFCRNSLPIMLALSGVLIFRPFALSVLTKTPTPNLVAYTWRRLLRIFPGYWLLALVIMLTLDRNFVSGFWYVLRVVTMQHVYNAGAVPFGMEQTWSMATDTAFYFLVPLVAWLCARMTRNVVDTATKAKLMLIPMVAIIAFGYGFDAWAHQAKFGPWAIQGNWPPVWFSYFVIGMILATLSAVAEVSPGRFVGWYRLAASKPLLCWGLAAGITLAYCFSPMGDQGTVNYPTVGMELFNTPIDLLIVALIMAPLTVPHSRSRFIKAVLTWKPLVFIAKVSYGLYLWHIAVICWFLGGLIGQHNLILAEVTVMGISLVLATISFYLLERPAQKLRIRLGKASREPSVAVLETTA